MRVPLLTYSLASWPGHTSIAALHQQSHVLPWRDWLRSANKIRSAGMSKVGVLQPPSQLMSLELHANEHIKALAQGKGRTGKVTLFDTNERVFIMEQNYDEVSSRQLIYPFVEGAMYSRYGLTGCITLSTHFGDYRIGGVNTSQGKHFVRYITRRCEPSLYKKEAWYDHNPQKWPV